MTDFYQVDLSDGIAQPERFPEALRPGYFAPDEMRVEQLLVLGKRLAANLIYFDSNNNRVGTWDELFATDPAFILAEIASTDTAKLEARYYTQIAKRSSSARADLIEEVVSLIDSWSRALQVSDQPQMILFTNRINQVIRDTLAEAVAEVRAVLGPGGGQVSARFASLGPVWKLPDEGLDDESPADSKRNRILDEAFHLSLGAIAHLKEFARTGLNLSEANRTQNPAVSLFVAFLKLYSHAQHTINRFPARRLDFYYRQLLGATTRGRMPDSVNLALTLAPGQPPTVVPKGTPFLAGKDAADQDIVFASDDDLELTDATVQSIRTFCLDSDPLVSPQRELGCVSSIRLDEFDTTSADNAGMPLFGGPASVTAGDARVGLAIASPLLHLREGERKITIDLICEANGGFPEHDEKLEWPESDPPTEAANRAADIRTARLPADATQAVDLLQEVSRRCGAAALTNASDVGQAQWCRRFCHLLGQLFAREAVSADWLSAQGREKVQEAAARVFGDPAAAAELPEDGTEAAELLQAIARLHSYEGACDASAPQVSRAQWRRLFCRLFGQTLARETMSSSSWLSKQAEATVRHAARLVFGDRPREVDAEGGAHGRTEPTIDVIEELLAQKRSALFYRLIRDSFDVRLTTGEGWLSYDNYGISPLPDRGDGPVGGLRLEISLSADAPAIVAYDPDLHDVEVATGEPVVMLTLNPNSMFFAYSLFAALDIRAVNLGVRVTGARALMAYSDLGQLDCSKPFAPFGPQPGQDSYMAIGSLEAARKPLTKACLKIEWGGLPRDFGGFEQYYRGYTADIGSHSIEVQTSVLAAGAWYAGESDPQRLFTTAAQTGQVSQHCRLDLLQGRPFANLKTDLAEPDYRLDNATRSGFFRVDLSPCEDPFGHAEYPLLLSTTLTANVKRRRPLPVPKPPYTPMINRISLDYSAEASIRFRTDRAVHPASGENRFFQVHPLGSRELAQSGRARPVPLMPRFRMHGYLLLGLSGSAPLGTVSLLFDLRGGEFRSIDQTISHAWFYLSGNEFRPLPQDAILRDTTASFSRSGIVTLVIPEDIDDGNTVLPGGGFWIAVGAVGDLHRCPRLHSVKTGALKATREISDDDTKFRQLAAGTISEAISAPAGVGLIEQPGGSFGGRPAEDEQRLITRTAERLHHKDRACQPWDYERMTLERFPDLYKAKCFANMSTEHDEPVPGELLIVVVPRADKAGISQSQQLLINAVRLEEIQKYLASKTSRFAHVSVRNAVYELVQVRCMVKLTEPSRKGRYVRELNDVISNFISPWRPGGYGASFGWRIRRKDIEACIGALDYVEFITDFSMLHIVQEHDQYYCLQDTARPAHTHNGSSATDVEHSSDEISPRYPWSLALPSRRHYIQTMAEIAEIKAQPTGVNELEVGSTLILDAGNSNG